MYLNVSLSYSAPISLTFASKAASWSRETRKAAFMIILSPIGLLAREATETSRSWSKISATYRSERAWSAASISRPYCMRAKYVEPFCEEISFFSRRMSSSSRLELSRMITSRSHRTLRPNSSLSSILASTSVKAS